MTFYFAADKGYVELADHTISQSKSKPEISSAPPKILFDGADCSLIRFLLSCPKKVVFKSTTAIHRAGRIGSNELFGCFLKRDCTC